MIERKLIVLYLPNDPSANIPDGHAENRAKNLYNMVLNYERPVTFRTSSEVAVMAVRTLIAEGKFDHNKVEFRFEDKSFFANERGIIQDWPKGWCEHHMNLSIRLLKAQVRKRNEDNKK